MRLLSTYYDLLEKIKQPYLAYKHPNHHGLAHSIGMCQYVVKVETFNKGDRQRLIKWLELLKKNPDEEPNHEIWQWGRSG